MGKKKKDFGWSDCHNCHENLHRKYHPQGDKSAKVQKWKRYLISMDI